MIQSETSWKITFDEVSSNHYLGRAKNNAGQRVCIDDGTLDDVLKNLIVEIVHNYEHQVIKTSVNRKTDGAVSTEPLVPIITVQIDLSLR